MRRHNDLHRSSRRPESGQSDNEIADLHVVTTFGPAEDLKAARLTGDRVVGLEEVLRVVALLNLTKAGEDIRREYVGYVEALLDVVEVAPSVVGLESRLVGPEPDAVRRHRFWHRDEADGERDERARQGSERSSALWCPGESATAVA